MALFRDSVISIGDNVFVNCPIENATIPAVAAKHINNKALKSVTIIGGECIGEEAFYNCTSLTNIIISDSVTGIGLNALSGCTSLESITVTENNMAYSSQDGILYNKEKTEFICIPKAIKGEVTIANGITEISSAFMGCSSLTSITIPDSVTSIGYSAFYNCSSLTSITIPNSVTSIGYSAFSSPQLNRF